MVGWNFIDFNGVICFVQDKDIGKGVVDIDIDYLGVVYDCVFCQVGLQSLLVLFVFSSLWVIFCVIRFGLWLVGLLYLLLLGVFSSMCLFCLRWMLCILEIMIGCCYVLFFLQQNLLIVLLSLLIIFLGVNFLCLLNKNMFVLFFFRILIL